MLLLHFYSDVDSTGMKKLLSPTKLAGFLLAITVAFMFTSWSKKMKFESSGVVPDAVGSVKIKTDKNKNHTIKVRVRKLTPADQLSPPRKTYVVWMNCKNSEARNIGQLTSSSGFLSKALKGSLNTVSSSKPSSLFITVEDDGDAQFPGKIILRTR